MGVACCKSSASERIKQSTSANKPDKQLGVLLKPGGGGSTASLLFQGLLKKGPNQEKKPDSKNREKDLRVLPLAQSSNSSPIKSKNSFIPNEDEVVRLSQVDDIQFSGLSPVKKNIELAAKTSAKIWDFEIIKSLFQSEKVFVYNCIDRASGEYFILKRIELSEEDMTENIIKLCKQIVGYVRRKLIPLSHPNLVKYISATFSAQTRSNDEITKS